jgi:glycine cleavage system aminomethyltransferase T
MDVLSYFIYNQYDATGIVTAARAAYRAGKTVVIGVIAKYLFYLGESIHFSVAGHTFYPLECGENKK